MRLKGRVRVALAVTLVALLPSVVVEGQQIDRERQVPAVTVRGHLGDPSWC